MHFDLTLLLVIFICCATVASNAIVLRLLYNVKMADKHTQNVNNVATGVEYAEETEENKSISFDAKSLTESELQRIEREAEFDLRISRIKDELAGRLPEVERKGTEAFTLHPNVYNLPHNIIADDFDSLPDVEFTN